MVLLWWCLSTTQSKLRTTPSTTMAPPLPRECGVYAWFDHMGSQGCARTPTVREKRTVYVVTHMLAITHTLTLTHHTRIHTHARLHAPTTRPCIGSARTKSNKLYRNIHNSITCIENGCNTFVYKTSVTCEKKSITCIENGCNTCAFTNVRDMDCKRV